ncbi:MAG: aspartyl protease family protein [Pseudomonadota bacterium]
MSHVHSTTFHVNITPQPQSGSQVHVQQSPIALCNLGYNMLIELSTASAFLKPGTSTIRNTISVWGHFDTGAGITTIDQSLAQHLGLNPIGQSNIRTANGNAQTNNYAADVSFVNSKLNSFQNLRISSCNLAGFNLANAIVNKQDHTNFGVLIGRDIMSKWSLTWHGPTSTVLIAD